MTHSTKGKLGLGLTLLATASLAFTGCSTATDKPAESSDKSAEQPRTKQASGELTLYTSEPQEKIDALIAKFNEQQPDVKITVFRAGTGDLTARIAAEEKAGNIGADLLLAADAPTFEKYAADGLLLEYQSEEESKLLEGFADPEHFYVGTRLIPTVIAINTGIVKDEPKSWQDLTKSEYAGKIAMPNPDVSGAAAYNAAVWLNDKQLGEKWLTALAANKPLIAESNGPVSQAVASGANPVGIVVDSLVRDLAAAGSPVKAVYPSEGVPFVTQPVGIFKNTKSPEAAKAFVDFLISKQGQEIAVTQNYLPIRADVQSPEGAPAVDKLNLLQPDLATIQKIQPDAVAKFNELFQ